MGEGGDVRPVRTGPSRAADSCGAKEWSVAGVAESLGGAAARM